MTHLIYGNLWNNDLKLMIDPFALAPGFDGPRQTPISASWLAMC